MFENKSDRELIFIYVIIAIIVALVIAFFNYITGVGIYYNIFAANVIFFCIFYMLYLPLKVRKAREKQERKKQK